MKVFVTPRGGELPSAPADQDAVVIFTETTAEMLQTEVLVDALKVYADRNIRYKDNWRRFGWRGCLFRLRERAERAWDDLWDAATPQTASTEGTTLSRDREDFADLYTDDLIDLINFAAFTVRAIHENNRDGEGGWW